MSDPDEYGEVAAQIAGALRSEAPEVQQAYRYLFARVASDAGLLTLIGQEIRAAGVRLIFQEPKSGAFYAVDRPSTWTAEEEERYVEDMRREFGLHDAS